MGSGQQEREKSPAGSTDEAEARRRIEAYLAPLYEDPVSDERPLSVRGVCKQIGMSVNTLYKYGLNQRLVAAEALRAAERQKGVTEEGSRLQQALQRLKAERDEWKQKYDALLEAHINLQHSIRLEPGLDMERVLARQLPKAVRNAPGTGRRNNTARIK